MSEIKIDSLQKFVEEVSKLDNRSELFFRGENQYFEKRIPSIYRASEGLIARKSKEYYERLFSENEENNFSDISQFKKMAELQHFGGVTRLIDITKNPLVALYFAIEDSYKDGYVYVYQNSELKTDDGDTAYIKTITNFINTEIVKDFLNAKDEDLYIKKLNEISFKVRNYDNKKEIKNDLQRAQIIISSKSNRRIAHQQGSFIIPAFESKIEYNDIIEEIDSSINELMLRDKEGKPVIFIIEKNFKEPIQRALSNFGVNAGTVYPDNKHQSENLISFLTNRGSATSKLEKDNTEVNALIKQLVDSTTFATTHYVINKLNDKLNERVDFKIENIKDLIQALSENNQVKWIINDDDINRFYIKILNQYGDDISIGTDIDGEKMIRFINKYGGDIDDKILIKFINQYPYSGDLAILTRLFKKYGKDRFNQKLYSELFNKLGENIFN